MPLVRNILDWRAKKNQNMNMKIFVTESDDKVTDEKKIAQCTDERSAAAAADARPSHSHRPMPYINTNQTLEAEVTWCLKLTQSHYSFKSSESAGS